MILGPPLINGVAYAHADIVLNLFGVPMIGVTAIDYADPQEITGNHSTGAHQTSVGFGPVKPVASITMTLELVETIQRIAPGGKIQNIPFFDIGVNYLPDSGVLVRHSLKKCRFKGRNVSSATGNSQIEEKIELFVADIAYTG